MGKKDYIGETGKGGLTEWSTKVFKALKHQLDNFWYSRNMQGNIAGYGRKVKLPANEQGKPDFGIIYDGVPVFIEEKTEIGRLSEAQINQKHRIIAAGGRWYVCRSKQDVYEVLVDVGIPSNVLDVIISKLERVRK